ncbi:MAG: phosphatase PAP2 family protein, partial [Chloroflexota bacterium]
MAVKRMVNWLRAHLTIMQYVTLHLLVGLAICIASLLVFYELVEEVILEQEFTTIDLTVANEFHAAATPPVTRFFELITMLGFQVIWVIGIGVGLYFLWKRQRLRLGIWVAALAGGEVLNFLLKGLFARPRPVFDDPLAVALYYSFPSGHAMMSLITYGFLAYFLYINLHRAWVRIIVTASLIVLVLLIGLSR